MLKLTAKSTLFGGFSGFGGVLGGFGGVLGGLPGPIGGQGYFIPPSVGIGLKTK